MRTEPCSALTRAQLTRQLADLGQAIAGAASEEAAGESGRLLQDLLSAMLQDSRCGVVEAAQSWQKRQGAAQIEQQRLKKLWSREAALVSQGYKLVAGLDEAGRGPLAGPVVAGAVILPVNLRLLGLNDSKKLSLTNRLRLEAEIKSEALAWAIGEASPIEIDTYNILEATKLAMKRALEGLALAPQYLLLDALTLDWPLPQEGIIRGDATCACISAASVLAKTHRDRLMLGLDQQYPQYDFAQNKGYPTLRHRQKVAELGPCLCHRQSFLNFLKK